MYDVIIMGRGPAALSASLYTVRANRKTLIIGKRDSRLLKADKIDNYFGFSESISGERLLDEGEGQAKRLGADFVDDEVLSLEMSDTFKVITAKQQYEAKSILIATGQQQQKASIKNLKDYEGMGVSYCSTCDGFFYNNRKVGVLGYKDFAVHEANELLANTKDITIYTNGKELETTEAYKDLVSQFKLNPNPIEKLEGIDSLERIIFKDGTSEELEGIFVAYESASGIDFARQLGIVTEGSDVVVDSSQQTNIEGIFAAGDCTGGLKQVATAVGEGANAGKAIVDYLRKIKSE